MKRPNMKSGFALAALTFVVGCGSSDNSDLGGGTENNTTPETDTVATATQCKPSYVAAQRTAALSLTGELPEWIDIKAMMDAETKGVEAQKAVYDAFIDKLLTKPQFAVEQVRFFRNTFATGNRANTRRETNDDGSMDYIPDQDCAASYAASLVVGDQPYTNLFTAAGGTCPKFDEVTGTFTPGDVLDANGAPLAMNGILNDPGLMFNYYSNMAFRPVRFIQETFACTKFPAESQGTPTPMGSALYTSPWRFESITGGETARINFQDTSAVVCANCHTTMNHLAPLYANFNMDTGLMTDRITVRVPVQGNPTARFEDWLPTGEPLAWRHDKPVQTIADLGKTMAADPEIGRCIVNRVWDAAFSRGDIVRDLATIPVDITAATTKTFVANNFNVKKLIREVYTSNEYVSR
jgi:hypothetical protein